jgi:hypothetical protein
VPPCWLSGLLFNSSRRRNSASGLLLAWAQIAALVNREAHSDAEPESNQDGIDPGPERETRTAGPDVPLRSASPAVLDGISLSIEPGSLWHWSEAPVAENRRCCVFCWLRASRRRIHLVR